jgi:hypothetical protein
MADSPWKSPFTHPGNVDQDIWVRIGSKYSDPVKAVWPDPADLFVCEVEGLQITALWHCHPRASRAQRARLQAVHSCMTCYTGLL